MFNKKLNNLKTDKFKKFIVLGNFIEFEVNFLSKRFSKWWKMNIIFEKPLIMFYVENLVFTIFYVY